MVDSAAVTRIVDLLLELDVLEALPRMGFLLGGITNPESVAAHCFGVAFAAMLMADALPEAVDVARVLRMALLHEVSEARVTDLPYDTRRYISPWVKSAAEDAAAHDLLGPIDQTYVSLWREFEAAETLEARVVRAADKIQLMAKVLRYDRQGRGELAEFWTNVDYNENDWGITLARQLFDEIRRRRVGDQRGGAG